MTSLNSNYASAIRGFRHAKPDNQVYQAASGGQFNQLSEDGELAAYALFWIDGSVQTPGAAPAGRQFLWGNLDDDNTTGWGIYLDEGAGGQLALSAALYAASGLRESTVLLSMLRGRPVNGTSKRYK